MMLYSCRATGDYLYALDLSSIRKCPYAPGHASIMGWFEEKVPVAGQEGHRSIEVDLCPRTILRRLVEYVGPTSQPNKWITRHFDIAMLNKFLGSNFSWDSRRNLFY